MAWEIKTLTRKISKERQKPDIKPEVEEYVNSTMLEIFKDLEQLREPMGFENFLIDEIQQEAEKLKDPEGDRDKPVCECVNSECPLKNGQLPLAIRQADSLTQGILNYRQEHATPIVLQEKQEEWREKKAKVQQQLSVVLVALQRNQVPPGAGSEDMEEATA